MQHNDLGTQVDLRHSRVMDIPPVSVHQRVPIILGSKEDVEDKTCRGCREFLVQVLLLYCGSQLFGVLIRTTVVTVVALLDVKSNEDHWNMSKSLWVTSNQMKMIEIIPSLCGLGRAGHAKINYSNYVECLWVIVACEVLRSVRSTTRSVTIQSWKKGLSVEIHFDLSTGSCSC